jgi:alpha-L-rhamnosidase
MQHKPLWIIRLSVFSACFLGTAALLHAAASVRVADLRCEYLANPLGLDVARPRLSWRLDARDPQERGQRQTSYRILVASTEELLGKDRGDLWDSGVRASGDSQLIEYGGQPMESGQQCYWKVRAQDEMGRWSPWSGAARWSMGLLRAEDWKAKWIGIEAVFVKGKGWPPPDNTIPDPWFRKSFELKDKPAQAFAYVASIGYHELYVNGRKVDDTVLQPGATDHRHRARYVAYDITPFLQRGQNVIGIWLGLSWSIFPHYLTNDRPASPIVMAQTEIQLRNGSRVQVITDASWKTHPSPNTLLGVWDFMHYGGELYDARREVPGWSTPGPDDSQWKPVVVREPSLTISAQKVEPNRVLKRLTAVSIKETGPGVYRADLGVNFAGYFEMDLSGAPGDRVEFQFSERENESMTHRLHSAYIIGPSGKGTFRNRFNYAVGRWVEIKGLKSQPSPTQIRGLFIRTAYARAAGFECDIPLLNRIYETTLWTFENLSLGGYVVDCPQRERMGYGGDAHATMRSALNNYSLGAFYTKWGEDWRDVQQPDGNLPYTAPTYWGGGGPGWSGYCITLPWEIYRRYGDTRILAENWPTMRRWLAFLETKSRENQLVRWGGEWDFLGDWLWPGAQGVNGDTRETLFFNNCYWIYNLQTAAQIAEVLNENEVAKTCRERAKQVGESVHRMFFNEADASYVNGFPAYLAMALLVELPPKEIRPAVWQRLEKEILVNRCGHIHAGITGGAFLFKLLLEHERNDLICAMLRQEDYPGWGDMLKRGATTFYEDWECKLSYLHSSYLYPGSWFIEGPAGIQNPQAGFKRFEIAPWIDAERGPRKTKAHYDSPYGRIETEWAVEGGNVRLRITVPPNTEATLRLNNVNANSLKEGGRVLEGKGMLVLPARGDEIALRLVPGRYEFQGALKPGRR